jgi:hypothetical protein
MMRTVVMGWALICLPAAAAWAGLAGRSGAAPPIAPAFSTARAVTQDPLPPAATAFQAAVPETTSRDSLVFLPSPPESTTRQAGLATAGRRREEDRWLSAPFGERLLTDLEQWRSESERRQRFEPSADYNRVDRLRVGLRYEVQPPVSLGTRIGARLDYALGRQRALYGIQIEQPIFPDRWLAVGASMVRRTDHSELQQIDDVENSLALLFGRQDYRDYFEREGFDVYALARVPGVSTVSLHGRSEEDRSLALDPGTRSFFHRDRGLRDNPPIDEGHRHSIALRFERLAHRTFRTRAGLYHWIDLERAGYGLGGDFSYTRLLMDVRSVLRLSPAATLALRMVGGHTLSGSLPVQKEFTVGGVDGLRAHRFSEYRGNQMALLQAEYTLGLWRISSQWFESGLHAIAFVDAGRAWQGSDPLWDIGRQRMQADGGLGISTSEDNVRVYVARNLQAPRSSVVVSMRLQRPF